jgi:leucyl-tRNA synthetase
VRIEGEGAERRARDVATGAEIAIGPIEKMSKSKRNTVGPEEIIGRYGADTARWFMLSDSPPERDVEWTDAGVGGAFRFVQRIWRLVGLAGATPARRTVTAPPTSDAAQALRRAAHRALAGVEADLGGLRFNVAIAKIYELVNAIAAAGSDGGAVDPEVAAARREAVELLVHMMAPIMPHFAEESWAALGHKDMVAARPWPKADPALLVDDTITLPIQVNGKKRAELTITATATQAEIERATLALDAVQRALDGAAPRRIVVVPKRIVNVVS